MVLCLFLSIMNLSYILASLSICYQKMKLGVKYHCCCVSVVLFVVVPLFVSNPGKILFVKKLESDEPILQKLLYIFESE